MEKKPLFDNVPDEELGVLLHQLLMIEGHDEVEIQHPTEGKKIVTKDNYKKTLQELTKFKKLSPAKRIIEKKRIKTAHQIKHRTGMIQAKFYVVDIQDEKNFGYDVDGVKINMEDMTFIPVSDYIPDIKIKSNECGAFVHPSNDKAPLRILTAGGYDEAYKN